jgi:hypothetical protein
MAQPVPIGMNWVAITDPGSQRTYYANTVTKVTQWTWPAELPA